MSGVMPPERLQSMLVYSTQTRSLQARTVKLHAASLQGQGSLHGSTHSGSQLAASNSLAGFLRGYTIVDEIGAGLLTRIYLAKDLLAKRTVVLKLLLKVDCRDPRTIDLRSALNKEYDHPNLATIYDLYEDEQYIVLVTKFFPYGDILSFVGANCAGFESEASSFVAHVMTGLEVLHKSGLYHGNITLDNILVYNDGEGFMLALNNYTMQKMISCSKTYRDAMLTSSAQPPELHSGKQLTTASDMWGIGVLAFVLLCGRWPTKVEDDLFAGPEWTHISLAAQQFVGSLLREEPAERLTIDEAIRHPWILNYPDTANPIPNIKQNYSTMAIERSMHTTKINRKYSKVFKETRKMLSIDSDSLH